MFQLITNLFEGDQFLFHVLIELISQTSAKRKDRQSKEIRCEENFQLFLMQSFFMAVPLRNTVKICSGPASPQY